MLYFEHVVPIVSNKCTFRGAGGGYNNRTATRLCFY